MNSNITAKQIHTSNVVVSFKQSSVPLPEPSQFFSAYPADAAKGAIFSDNPALEARVFELPTLGYMWIFDKGRIRLEDRMHRQPSDSKLAPEFLRVLAKLYPHAVPEAYGFNYDVVYRMGSVIPSNDVMGSFIEPGMLESVTGFGWQYTLSREKGRRQETYFFKVVSPLEYSVHANHHFNDKELPKDAALQKAFEACYADTDKSIRHISF